MNTHQNAWNGFLDLCLTTTDKNTLDELLDFFFTPEEKNDLAMRFLIVKELMKKEKTQRQIAKELNVSIAKITRGSNAIKRMPPKLLNYLLKEFSNRI